MSKHLAPAVVRRTPQNLRPAVLSRAVRIGAGAAFLAVYTFGFQATGPVLSSGQLPAEMPGDIAVNMPLESAAVASAAVASNTAASNTAASNTAAAVSTTGAVSASADAFLSYSRTVVFTETKTAVQKLDVVSTQRAASRGWNPDGAVGGPCSHLALWAADKSHHRLGRRVSLGPGLLRRLRNQRIRSGCWRGAGSGMASVGWRQQSGNRSRQRLDHHL
jgi:hypothetical protein